VLNASITGVFEAGFVPGCAFLIGSYYMKNEFLRRYAVFFSAAIVAGAFNGLFSTLLAAAGGAGGLKAWQWIFVAEGLITCCFALVAFPFMIKMPEQTKMFTPEEKDVLLRRLKADREEVAHEHVGKRVLEALFDWKVWLA
jgi:MFS family permease